MSGVATAKARWARQLLVSTLTLATLFGLTSVASAASGRLNMYEARVSLEQLGALEDQGYDVAGVERAGKRMRVDLVLSRGERATLAGKGISTRLMRDRKGRTVARRAALQAQNGFEVWRDWDGPDGIAAEMRRFAREHRPIAQLHDIGDTHEGRDVLAIRLTQGVRDVPVGSRPAVLYQGTTHAREWISTEVDRRLMHWFAEGWPKNKQVHSLLKTTELWFVPVVNPDGYQYTFDSERLWRKNLRDNDEDGTIGFDDGVDLNRNYPEHWNYDDEGSSSQLSSQTYRGPTAGSEPEVVANMGLFDEVDFSFAISYHSYGQLLLYTQGWQVQTPSADDPIYVALTGTDDDPAVPGFDPGVGADLYTTNGEFTDWAHGTRGTLAWTPELSEGCDGCGFVFPDNEQLVQEEFERNLQFARNVARSAGDPDDPVSHMGLDTEPFYLDVSEIDPWKGGNPASDLTFDLSYSGGAAQPVEVLAKRSLGDVTLHYSINGDESTAPTEEAPEGETFGGNNAYDDYYHYLRGEVTGASVGDEVEVWFTGGGEESDHFTYTVADDPNADVLILAAEDRTGASPVYANPGTPNYLSYFQDALTASGLTSDVYDIDARGRTAPHHLGVLGHYDAVVWYTGDDLVPREPGWGPGNASRLVNDTMLAVRAYLNEGGKLLYTGQWAGGLWNGVAGTQFYDPVANEQCVVGGELVLERCQVISDKNDFVQYYLGAFLYNSDAGTDPDTGEPLPVLGVSAPFEGTAWDLNGPDSADNQGHTASFVTTGSVLGEEAYPQFASDAPAVWETGVSGAFEPFDGSQYMYSDRADISYKRLARTIDLTGLGAGEEASLSFRFSYDAELDWDYVFVEAHTVGSDDWTTLPDVNGHTGSDTGQSCPEGWFELHPWLERYQGADCSGANAETGGEWHAATGRSAGWEPWEVDLSQYAGEQVEVSITYASDWGTQAVGAFVDAIEVSTGEGSTSFEEDADPMDGWDTPGPPEGSDPNPNDWRRTASVGFEEGAVASTDDTLFFGFGFEGIAGAATRADVMGRSMDHLLGGP